MEQKNKLFVKRQLEKDTPPNEIWRAYKLRREAEVDVIVKRIQSYRLSKDSV